MYCVSIVSIFDPKGFEEIFRNWVREIVGEVKGVVAIDGKLMLGASKCDKAGWDEDYLSKLLEGSAFLCVCPGNFLM